MRYLSFLGWLLKVTQNLLKNPLFKFSLRAVSILWSNLSRSKYLPGKSSKVDLPLSQEKDVHGARTPHCLPPPSLGFNEPAQAVVMEGCAAHEPPFPSAQSTPEIRYDTTLENSGFPRPSSSLENFVEPKGDVISGTKASLAHPTIHPLFPECIGRYDRGVVVPREETSFTLDPLTTTFKLLDDPLGWTPQHHPEGGLYFYHEQKGVFTDANVHDNTLLLHVHSVLDSIDDFLRASNIERPPEDDLVLELQQEDGALETYYYVVNHAKRVIYFFDEFDASNLPVWPEVDGVTSPTHIKHEIEAQYWLARLLILSATSHMVVELRDIILYSIADTMLSKTSTSPYTVDDLQKMLILVNDFPYNTGSEFRGSTCALSALMFVFARQRFFDFHGQPGARLSRDQSVYGQASHGRSWLIRSLSPALFYAPEIHLRGLEKVWIDGLLRETLWNQFISKLTTEWQEFTLYATVLLNANVAFLAIQSIDVNQDPYRSPAQILSYVSITSSIGSIILGLLLVRQNRTKAKETAYDISVSLHRRTSVRVGLETLAIMFSLPYALLMWGMVTFLAAFTCMCFKDSNISTRLVMGIMWAAISILIVWCVWSAWESRPSASCHEAEVENKDPPSKEEESGWRPKKLWSRPALLPRQLSHDSEATAV